jgi:hypothetical protein
MQTSQLPPPTPHIPQTLKIEYVSGDILKVPYFDHASAIAFLSLEEGVSNYEVVPYTRE